MQPAFRLELRLGKPFRRRFLAASALVGVLLFSDNRLSAEPKAKNSPARSARSTIPGLVALDPSESIKEKLLGLRVGITLEEVREEMRSLKATDLAGKRPHVANENEEEEEGQKRAWKLPASEPFDWVMVAADRDGIVTLITARYREPKPFEKIADLEKAAARSGRRAAWNVLRPKGNFLVIADGAEGKARTISMKLARLHPMFSPAKKTPQKKTDH